jgi:hypothetical protein
MKPLDTVDGNEAAARAACICSEVIDERWRYYGQLAGIERTVPRMPQEA